MHRSLIPALVGVALLTCASSTTALAAVGDRDTIPPALAPLGTEHSELRASFDFLLRRATAASATRTERLALVAFLRNTLIPHAQNEELVLYPALDSVLGTRGYATATMVLDHRAIASRTLELVSLLDQDPAGFQQKAVAVGALVEHHFANEEEFVLPNLARKMNDGALRQLLRRMNAHRVVP
jgi:iron-sulfur cluster repair protein YtfE (RIC family)